MRIGSTCEILIGSTDINSDRGIMADASEVVLILAMAGVLFTPLMTLILVYNKDLYGQEGLPVQPI